MSVGLLMLLGGVAYTLLWQMPPAQQYCCAICSTGHPLLHIR